MSWAEPIVFALILAGLVLVGFASNRSGVGSSGTWAAGWTALLCSGLVLQVPTHDIVVDMVAALLAPIFPALMLAGALRYASRAVPAWLWVGTIVVGALRAALVSQGWQTGAQSLSLTIDPPLCVAAAVAVFSTARSNGSVLQQLLAPGLLLLGLLESIDAASRLLDWSEWNPLVGWMALGAPVAMSQFSATLELLGDRLKRTRGQRDESAAALAKTVGQLRETQRHMEERIEARTHELYEQVKLCGRIEESLRISEERYRNASELASDFSFEARLDSAGELHITWLTGAFTRITGYSAEEARILDWIGIIHPDDNPALVRSLATVKQGGSDALEARIITKEGGVRWILAQAMGVRNEETGEMVIYCTGHDVTETKLAERENEKLHERMRQAQKLESLGALARGVAHDFNNLLSVILGNAAVLMRNLPEDSELRSRAERIRSSARYAADLTNQMLTYAGSAPLARQVVDLSQLVDEMTRLIASGATPSIRIEAHCANQDQRIEGDPTQVRQVLLNLVTNASEALGDTGGTVRISTGVIEADAMMLADNCAGSEVPEGPYVYLEVSDEGPGMDSETRTRLFEPFFTTRFSGRGLGLAVVLGIVRAHHGAIIVESELGRGTTFRVLFPRYDGLDPVIVAKPSERKLAPAEGLVLVIDDEEPVRELAEVFLRKAGFDVCAASGGREGLELFKKNAESIRVVLLDLTMPEISGEQVLEELRRLNPVIPIVIASGFTYEIAEDRIGGRKGIAFVQKPYDPEELIDRVRQALSWTNDSPPAEQRPIEPEASMKYDS